MRPPSISSVVLRGTIHKNKDLSRNDLNKALHLVSTQIQSNQSFVDSKPQCPSRSKSTSSRVTQDVPTKNHNVPTEMTLNRNFHRKAKPNSKMKSFTEGPPFPTSSNCDKNQGDYVYNEIWASKRRFSLSSDILFCDASNKDTRSTVAQDWPNDLLTNWNGNMQISLDDNLKNEVIPDSVLKEFQSEASTNNNKAASSNKSRISNKNIKKSNSKQSLSKQLKVVEKRSVNYYIKKTLENNPPNKRTAGVSPFKLKPCSKLHKKRASKKSDENSVASTSSQSNEQSLITPKVNEVDVLNSADTTTKVNNTETKDDVKTNIEHSKFEMQQKSEDIDVEKSSHIIVLNEGKTSSSIIDSNVSQDSGKDNKSPQLTSEPCVQITSDKNVSLEPLMSADQKNIPLTDTPDKEMIQDSFTSESNKITSSKLSPDDKNNKIDESISSKSSTYDQNLVPTIENLGQKSDEHNLQPLASSNQHLTQPNGTVNIETKSHEVLSEITVISPCDIITPTELPSDLKLSNFDASESVSPTNLQSDLKPVSSSEISVEASSPSNNLQSESPVVLNSKKKTLSESESKNVLRTEEIVPAKLSLGTTVSENDAPQSVTNKKIQDPGRSESNMLPTNYVKAVTSQIEQLEYMLSNDAKTTTSSEIGNAPESTTDLNLSIERNVMESSAEILPNSEQSMKEFLNRKVYCVPNFNTDVFTPDVGADFIETVNLACNKPLPTSTSVNDFLQESCSGTRGVLKLGKQETLPEDISKVVSLNKSQESSFQKQISSINNNDGSTSADKTFLPEIKSSKPRLLPANNVKKNTSLLILKTKITEKSKEKANQKSSFLTTDKENISTPDKSQKLVSTSIEDSMKQYLAGVELKMKLAKEEKLQRSPLTKLSNKEDPDKKSLITFQKEEGTAKVVPLEFSLSKKETSEKDIPMKSSLLKVDETPDKVIYLESSVLKKETSKKEASLLKNDETPDEVVPLKFLLKRGETSKQDVALVSSLLENHKSPDKLFSLKFSLKKDNISDQDVSLKSSLLKKDETPDKVIYLESSLLKKETSEKEVPLKSSLLKKDETPDKLFPFKSSLKKDKISDQDVSLKSSLLKKDETPDKVIYLESSLLKKETSEIEVPLKSSMLKKDETPDKIVPLKSLMKMGKISDQDVSLKSSLLKKEKTPDKVVHVKSSLLKKDEFCDKDVPLKSLLKMGTTFDQEFSLSKNEKSLDKAVYLKSSLSKKDETPENVVPLKPLLKNDVTPDKAVLLKSSLSKKNETPDKVVHLKSSLLKQGDTIENVVPLKPLLKNDVTPDKAVLLKSSLSKKNETPDKVIHLKSSLLKQDDTIENVVPLKPLLKNDVTPDKAVHLKSSLFKKDVTPDKVVPLTSSLSKNDVTPDKPVHLKSSLLKNDETPDIAVHLKSSLSKNDVTPDKAVHLKSSLSKKDQTPENVVSLKSFLKNDVTPDKAVHLKSSLSKKGETPENVVPLKSSLLKNDVTPDNVVHLKSSLSKKDETPENVPLKSAMLMKNYNSSNDLKIVITLENIKGLSADKEEKKNRLSRDSVSKIIEKNIIIYDNNLLTESSLSTSLNTTTCDEDSKTALKPIDSDVRSKPRKSLPSIYLNVFCPYDKESITSAEVQKEKVSLASTIKEADSPTEMIKEAKSYEKQISSFEKDLLNRSQNTMEVKKPYVFKDVLDDNSVNSCKSYIGKSTPVNQFTCNLTLNKDEQNSNYFENNLTKKALNFNQHMKNKNDNLSKSPSVDITDQKISSNNNGNIETSILSSFEKTFLSNNDERVKYIDLFDGGINSSNKSVEKEDCLSSEFKPSKSIIDVRHPYQRFLDFSSSDNIVDTPYNEIESQLLSNNVNIFHSSYSAVMSRKIQNDISQSLSDSKISLSPEKEKKMSRKEIKSILSEQEEKLIPDKIITILPEAIKDKKKLSVTKDSRSFDDKISMISCDKSKQSPFLKSTLENLNFKKNIEGNLSSNLKVNEMNNPVSQKKNETCLNDVKNSVSSTDDALPLLISSLKSPAPSDIKVQTYALSCVKSPFSRKATLSKTNSYLNVSSYQPKRIKGLTKKETLSLISQIRQKSIAPNQKALNLFKNNNFERANLSTVNSNKRLNRENDSIGSKHMLCLDLKSSNVNKSSLQENIRKISDNVIPQTGEKIENNGVFFKEEKKSSETIKGPRQKNSPLVNDSPPYAVKWNYNSEVRAISKGSDSSYLNDKSGPPAPSSKSDVRETNNCDKVDDIFDNPYHMTTCNYIASNQNDGNTCFLDSLNPKLNSNKKPESILVSKSSPSSEISLLERTNLIMNNCLKDLNSNPVVGEAFSDAKNINSIEKKISLSIELINRSANCKNPSDSVSCQKIFEKNDFKDIDPSKISLEKDRNVNDILDKGIFSFDYNQANAETESNRDNTKPSVTSNNKLFSEKVDLKKLKSTKVNEKEMAGALKKYCRVKADSIRNLPDNVEDLKVDYNVIDPSVPSDVMRSLLWKYKRISENMMAGETNKYRVRATSTRHKPCCRVRTESSSSKISDGVRAQSDKNDEEDKPTPKTNVTETTPENNATDKSKTNSEASSKKVNKKSNLTSFIDPNIWKYILLFRNIPFKTKREDKDIDDIKELPDVSKRSILDLFRSVDKSTVIIQKDFYTRDKIMKRIKDEEGKLKKPTIPIDKTVKAKGIDLEKSTEKKSASVNDVTQTTTYHTSNADVDVGGESKNTADQSANNTSKESANPDRSMSVNQNKFNVHRYDAFYSKVINSNEMEAYSDGNISEMSPSNKVFAHSTNYVPGVNSLHKRRNIHKNIVVFNSENQSEPVEGFYMNYSDNVDEIKENNNNYAASRNNNLIEVINKSNDENQVSPAPSKNIPEHPSRSSVDFVLSGHTTAGNADSTEGIVEPLYSEHALDEPAASYTVNQSAKPTSDHAAAQKKESTSSEHEFKPKTSENAAQPVTSKHGPFQAIYSEPAHTQAHSKHDHVKSISDTTIKSTIPNHVSEHDTVQPISSVPKNFSEQDTVQPISSTIPTDVVSDTVQPISSTTSKPLVSENNTVQPISSIIPTDAVSDTVQPISSTTPKPLVSEHNTVQPISSTIPQHVVSDTVQPLYSVPKHVSEHDTVMPISSVSEHVSKNDTVQPISSTIPKHVVSDTVQPISSVPKHVSEHDTVQPISSVPLEHVSKNDTVQPISSTIPVVSNTAQPISSSIPKHADSEHAHLKSVSTTDPSTSEQERKSSEEMPKPSVPFTPSPMQNATLPEESTKPSAPGHVAQFEISNTNISIPSVSTLVSPEHVSNQEAIGIKNNSSVSLSEPVLPQNNIGKYNKAGDFMNQPMLNQTAIDFLKKKGNLLIKLKEDGKDALDISSYNVTYYDNPNKGFSILLSDDNIDIDIASLIKANDPSGANEIVAKDGSKDLTTKDDNFVVKETSKPTSSFPFPQTTSTTSINLRTIDAKTEVSVAQNSNTLEPGSSVPSVVKSYFQMSGCSAKLRDQATIVETAKKNLMGLGGIVDFQPISKITGKTNMLNISSGDPSSINNFKVSSGAYSVIDGKKENEMGPTNAKREYELSSSSYTDDIKPVVTVSNDYPVINIQLQLAGKGLKPIPPKDPAQEDVKPKTPPPNQTNTYEDTVEKMRKKFIANTFRSDSSVAVNRLNPKVEDPKAPKTLQDEDEKKTKIDNFDYDPNSNPLNEKDLKLLENYFYTKNNPNKKCCVGKPKKSSKYSLGKGKGMGGKKSKTDSSSQVIDSVSKFKELIEKYANENYMELNQYTFSVVSPSEFANAPRLSSLNKVTPIADVSEQTIASFSALKRDDKESGFNQPVQGIINIDLLANPILKEKFATVPSVTKILNDTMSDSSKSALDKWKMRMIALMGEANFQEFYKAQLDQGKDFHESVKGRLMGRTELSEKHKDNLCLKSIEWVLKDISDVTAVESFVVHPSLGYKGIFDCVAKYKEKPVLIEWKHSSKKKSKLSSTYDAPLQMAAYMGALSEDKNYNLQVDSGLVVVAHADGSPAELFEVNAEDSQKFWTLWLQRLSHFVANYHQKAPTP